MKIKTITCHRVYNYGASLQAFALQFFLEKLGHDVRIINFLPYFYFSYDIFKIPEQSAFYPITNKIKFLRYLLGPITNRAMVRSYARKKAFDEFERKYLKLTSDTYYTSDDLKINPPSGDVYICGSDQIWSPFFKNGSEPAFYLDFGEKCVNRLSYAASFGASSLPEEKKDFVTQEISNLNHISVREGTGVNILKELGYKAERVLDPVFLLGKDDWMKISGQSSLSLPKEYILLYDFVGDDIIGKFAQEVSKKKGVPVIAINDLEGNRYSGRNIKNAGPLDFVKAIANASVVISNSFHATAFSIIMEREFFSFPISTQKSSSRIKEMCEMVGLTDRFLPCSYSDKIINYNNVKECLDIEIKHSKHFLEKALNS